MIHPNTGLFRGKKRNRDANIKINKKKNEEKKFNRRVLEIWQELLTVEADYR